MNNKTLKQVLIENPGLTSSGWRNWHTKKEDFKAWREETASDEFKEQFEAALALLETAIPIKTPADGVHELTRHTTTRPSAGFLLRPLPEPLRARRRGAAVRWC